jgi:hypothetical protein
MTRNTILLTVAGLMMVSALTMAGVTIWLLMTAPTAVASAVHGADVMSLMRMVAGTIYQAFLDIVRYFVQV